MFAILNTRSMEKQERNELCIKWLHDCNCMIQSYCGEKSCKVFDKHCLRYININIYIPHHTNGLDGWVHLVIPLRILLSHVLADNVWARFPLPAVSSKTWSPTLYTYGIWLLFSLLLYLCTYWLCPASFLNLISIYFISNIVNHISAKL